MVSPVTLAPWALDVLSLLESEAIHIIREVAASSTGR